MEIYSCGQLRQSFEWVIWLIHWSIDLTWLDLIDWLSFFFCCCWYNRPFAVVLALTIKYQLSTFHCHSVRLYVLCNPSDFFWFVFFSFCRGKTSLAFQAAVSMATDNKQVTFIRPKVLSLLPLPVHGMPTPEPTALQLVKLWSVNTCLCVCFFFCLISFLHWRLAGSLGDVLCV